MAFRAGDVVKHGPSGETWTLAVDEDNGWIYWCGWPPDGCGKVGDCTLVETATDEERVEILRDVARARSDHGDLYQVARIALRTLHAEKLCSESCAFCDTERRSGLSAARDAIVDAAVKEWKAAKMHDDCMGDYKMTYDERCRRENLHREAKAARRAAVDRYMEMQENKDAR
jgi:hypothetical protein